MPSKAETLAVARSAASAPYGDLPGFYCEDAWAPTQALVPNDPPPAPRRTRLLAAAYRAVIERSVLAPWLFWRLPAEPQAVALTFDDGPDPEQTPRILDVLARYGARATFFLVGRQAARHPELVRRVAAEGHAIGNHTLRHDRCNALSYASLAADLEEMDALIEAVRPRGPLPAFRPPFGAIGPLQAVRLAHQGRRVVMWSRDSRDYRGATVPEIAALGEAIERRDIVLLHDRFPNTAAGLPLLLEGLRRRGLETVTVDDLVE